MSQTRDAADVPAASFSTKTLHEDFSWFSSLDPQPPTTMAAQPSTRMAASRFSDDEPSPAFLSMLSNTLLTGPSTAEQPTDTVVPTYNGGDANTDMQMDRRLSHGSGTTHDSRSSGSSGTGGSDRGAPGGADLESPPQSAGAAAIISAVRSHPQMLKATAARASPSDIRVLARHLVVCFRSADGSVDASEPRPHRGYTFSADEKRALRVILNRSAAERSRSRKRARVESLEGSLEQKEDEIQALRGQVARLTGLVGQLQHALRYGRPGPSGRRDSY